MCASRWVFSGACRGVTLYRREWERKRRIRVGRARISLYSGGRAPLKQTSLSHSLSPTCFSGDRLWHVSCARARERERNRSAVWCDLIRRELAFYMRNAVYIYIYIHTVVNHSRCVCVFFLSFLKNASEKDRPSCCVYCYNTLCELWQVTRE